MCVHQICTEAAQQGPAQEQVPLLLHNKPVADNNVQKNSPTPKATNDAADHRVVGAKMGGVEWWEGWPWVRAADARLYLPVRIGWRQTQDGLGLLMHVVGDALTGRKQYS